MFGRKSRPVCETETNEKYGAEGKTCWLSTLRSDTIALVTELDVATAGLPVRLLVIESENLGAHWRQDFFLQVKPWVTGKSDSLTQVFPCFTRASATYMDMIVFASSFGCVTDCHSLNVTAYWPCHSDFFGFGFM